MLMNVLVDNFHSINEENQEEKIYYLDRDFDINELIEVVLSFKNYKSRGDDKVF